MDSPAVSPPRSSVNSEGGSSPDETADSENMDSPAVSQPGSPVSSEGGSSPDETADTIPRENMDSPTVSPPGSPVNSEGGSSPDETADTIPRFKCTPTFKEVAISVEDEALYAEDILEAAELWLIKAPHNFDAKKLSKKDISLTGRQVLNEMVDSDVGYELLPSTSGLTDKRLPRLLLPSRDETNLVPAPVFEGELSVLETMALPSILLPPSPPRRTHELPPGLKQRFQPFGWEEPSKLVKPAGVAGSRAKEKRKSSKDKKGKKKTRDSTSVDVGKVEDQRLPHVNEAEAVDEEDGDIVERKEHRKSKKRKKERHAQEEESQKTEVPSEEKKHKKKKKHKDV